MVILCFTLLITYYDLQQSQQLIVMDAKKNSFWIKVNKIAKFRILDNKYNSQFWSKFQQKLKQVKNLDNVFVKIGDFG